MTDNRERTLTEAFVSVANSLANGLDPVDLLSGLTADCAQLLDIESAGLLLADAQGVLHVVAASSERARTLELFQLQREQGPCLECFRTGAVVAVADLHEEAERWPEFVATAIAAGFASVHALPMRLRDNVLGALGLFGATPGPLADDDLNLGQALAHVASIALVVDKAATDKEAINQQLQVALESRIVLEQAKGLLAQLGDLDMDQAFAVLRSYARAHNQRLSDVAQSVVTRAVPAQQLIDHATGVIQLPPTPPGR